MYRQEKVFFILEWGHNECLTQQHLPLLQYCLPFDFYPIYTGYVTAKLR